MKILKLKFKNLNSLKGEWFIDFTDPAFINDGLFAIIGPTGAGKTTILDAICLSLYGRTPRLDSITNSSNEIMNRVSTECFAQTTFSCDDGDFRSSFEQHYSSSKRGANLQPPKMELANDATNEILANSKSQVPPKVVELIGLTYEQFTRAVLLAQGQFKKFLDSNANDRSELLETITGTQIYSLISEKVFERTKKEKDELEQLNNKMSGIDILSDDDRKALKEDLEKSNSESKELKAKIDELNKQLQWVKDVKKFKIESEEIKRKIAQNNDNFEAFDPQRQQLIRDASAQKIEADYRVTEHNKKSLENLDTKIADSDRKIKGLTIEIAKNEKGATDAAVTLTSAQNELKTQKPTLEEVKQLDTIIAQKRNDIEPEQAELNQLQSKFAQACSKANISAENLSDDLTTERIESQISVSLCGATISETRQALNKIRDKKSALKELLKIKTEINENKESIQKLQEDLEQYNQRVKDLKNDREKLDSDLKKAESYQKSLNKNITLSKIILSLEERRKNLVDGAPCPLCGATSHPYGQDTPPDTLTEDEEKLDATTNEIRELQDKINNADKDIARVETQIANADQDVRKLDLKNDSLQKQSNDICDNRIICDHDVTVKEIEFRIQLVTEKSLKTQTSLENAENLDALKEPVQFRDALNKQKAAVKQKQDALKELTDKRNKLFGTDDPEQRFQQLSNAVEAARNKLQQYNQTVAAKKAELASTSQNLEAQQEERKKAFKLYEDSLAAFNKKLEEQLFTSPEEFNQSLLTDDLRERFQKRQKELDEQKTRLEEQQKINRESLLKLEEQNLTDKSEDELEQSCNKKNAEYTSILVTIGSKKEQLEANQQRQNKFDKIKLQFDNQKVVVNRWEKLNSLIGSADGKKFRKIVQRISLEILIDYANEQMAILSPRYQLTLPQTVDAQSDEEEKTTQNAKTSGGIPKEDLAIYCIDSWQGGAIRPTTNLSGGEGFLISLALALGLSKMSSRNKSLETLFLDEGFGTLDDETLQTALDAINKFQYSDDSNKLVGIISHVDALKERIANKIEVSRSAAGTSVLSGPGVTKIS